MTHPVLIDSLLERYEFPPHDGSPVILRRQDGSRYWAEDYANDSMSMYIASLENGSGRRFLARWDAVKGRSP
jgi:hypothetical protein